MAFLMKLVALVAVVSLAAAIPTTRRPEQEAQDSYIPQAYVIDGALDQLPTNLQLPRAEAASVPFFTPDLSTIMKAPQYDPKPDYYAVPIPAQDLIAPVEGVWNPENDPKYFYEIPASVLQQKVPTNSYPKKYNKEIHSKSKPFSSKPKQEITLQPIDNKEIARKQKELNKVFSQLAKKENQKEFQVHELQGAETGFTSGFDSEGVSHGDRNRGLSADLTASLGITSPHSSSHGERLEFHMVGHDGPHSYKWGYDTGKGHNRQFRFEERDKEGIVKGHFGFYDKHGKLQMVNYDAYPHEGYHAEGNFGKY